MKVLDGRQEVLARRGLIVLMASLAPAVLLTSQASAQWTEYGGPGRVFKADSTGLAKEWPADGPPKLWSRELGGGYSAILADAGRLYTMYRADDKERVICLEAKTGKTVWEHAYDSSPREGHIDQFGKGPRATPLLSDGRLYTVGVAGLMHCLDAYTGKVIWSHDLWGDFAGNVRQHGYASSPIAYKDTVIVLVGGKDQSIVAFNRTDGSVAWKSLSFENSYSSPKIINIHGQDQLITFMANEVIGVDPSTGQLKWQFKHGNQYGQNVCMPLLVGDDTLFVSTLMAGTRGLKLTPSGDSFDVEEVWSTRKIQLYHVNSIQVGDYVYASTGFQPPHFLAAVNAKTGKIAWRKRGFAKASLVLADGRLIILEENGNLALATATPEDLVVHSKVKLLEEVAWTVPTVVGKTMYVRDKRSIMALDLG